MTLNAIRTYNVGRSRYGIVLDLSCHNGSVGVNEFVPGPVINLTMCGSNQIGLLPAAIH